MTPAGTLYVVATPIGNLEDLTFRALRILREVDLIAAEDTRRTAKLLARYEIRKPLTSLREHNEQRESDRLIDQISLGWAIALVSDAGTPGIADPGAHLVRRARERGVNVVPIPGASAVAAALSVSGLDADEFVFFGFPPHGGTARTDWFDRIAAEPRTTVFFEAPHRIRRTLSDLQARSATREIQAFRELTKINESLVVSPNFASAEVTEKGEFTVVLGPAVDLSNAKEPDHSEIVRLFGGITETSLFSREEVLAIIACQLKSSVKVVAKVIKKAEILAKQQKSPALDPDL